MGSGSEEKKRILSTAAVAFRRSISFSAVPRPFRPVPCRGSTRDAAERSFRARSISLPGRLHPLASRFWPELHDLRSWSPSSPASLSDGLTRVHRLLATLPDLLNRPQVKHSLRRRSLSSRLLDDLLRLADANASFRSTALELKHCLSATCTALRRRKQDSRLLAFSCCLRLQRRTEKQLLKLTSSVRAAAGRSPQLIVSSPEDEAAELANVMSEVIRVAAATSAVVFNAVAALSAASTAATATEPPMCTWIAPLLRWREKARLKLTKDGGAVRKSEGAEEEERRALERLQEMEESVAELERGSCHVFTSLVNIRVYLLNILTPGY
ncbi:hypothetical protein Cni_G14698 [Canna indica]|uniref:Uncharacterized protein n=1 Tax=Canna indica TaxID=4628 RepID=A0AAQ3KCK6_9LILI|nr:hypothetical protein Cni_G14698 [Canna indica]